MRVQRLSPFRAAEIAEGKIFVVFLHRVRVMNERST